MLKRRPGFRTRQRGARERETRTEGGREEDKGVVGRLEIQWIPTTLLGQTGLARAQETTACRPCKTIVKSRLTKNGSDDHDPTTIPVVCTSATASSNIRPQEVQRTTAHPSFSSPLHAGYSAHRGRSSLFSRSPVFRGSLFYPFPRYVFSCDTKANSRERNFGENGS